MRIVEIVRDHPIMKMHGCGNDFVVLMDPDGRLSGRDLQPMVKVVCARHTGVGADGLIAIMPARVGAARWRMQYLNSDGSGAQMCGNGVRCVAKYLADSVSGVTVGSSVSIDTDAGLIDVEIETNTDLEATVRVNMGAPVLTDPSQVVGSPCPDGVVRVQSGDAKDLVYVGMGNPHAVAFCDDPASLVRRHGPTIEQDTSVFPQGVNIEFVRVEAPDELTMRVWELSLIHI